MPNRHRTSRAYHRRLAADSDVAQSIVLRPIQISARRRSSECRRNLLSVISSEFNPSELALTVTESVSTGAAPNACCNSVGEEKVLPLICRAGKRKVNEVSANGYGSSTKCREAT